ncbi:MAG: fasciclin domain-containing protein [Trueperaceae bacterium]|nr:fasciclin domain-containing protein [Trueperaceae bacterium]
MTMKRTFRALLALAVAGILAACGNAAAPAERDSIAEIASANENLTVLVAALDAAGLVGTFADDAAGPFTVFAANDAAFTALLGELGLTAEQLLADTDLLTSVLTYHVVEGNNLFIQVAAQEVLPTLNGMPIAVSGGLLDGSTSVVSAGIVASNGVIHVIDEVLVPSKTIADIAVADSRFSTLVAALSEADLVAAVADVNADLTVFAPTNDAFGAALDTLGLTAAELLASDDLADILLYHVVPGTFLAADVIAAAPFDAPTLQGSTISVEVVDGGVVLNGTVNVIITDVKAVNGVIHAIDFVLLPPAE